MLTFLFDLQIFQTNLLLDDGPCLHSEMLPELPVAVSNATAIVINKNVFICGGVCEKIASSVRVHKYSFRNRKWTTLPDAPQYRCEATAINNCLVIIGGRKAQLRQITNQLSTWTGNNWRQDHPPMPHKRVRPGVASFDTFVIVAGGWAEDNQTLLRTIDVLNTTTNQWCTLNNLQLPQPMGGMKLTVCATHLYVASATIHSGDPTDTAAVIRLPVSELERVLTNEQHRPRHPWTKMAPTPHYHSTLLNDTMYPVAVGGRHTETSEPTSDIAVYHPHCNTWSSVGQLLAPRMRCAVVSLNTTSFLVLGGCHDIEDHVNTLLRSVELVRMQ